jgi:hypothetical protein
VTPVTVVAIAACAALLCSDTSRLALMPLPRQALGADAQGLTLARDSGVDSNAGAARNAGHGVTAADLARQGRITGYTLDWQATGTTPHTLLGVQTIAELYRSAGAAARGLGFWGDVTKRLARTRQNGVTISLAPFEARVGDGSYAFVLTYRLTGRAVGYVGDVVFRTGNLLGAVFVTTTEEAPLRGRTLALAEKLLARMLSVVRRPHA